MTGTLKTAEDKTMQAKLCVATCKYFQRDKKREIGKG